MLDKLRAVEARHDQLMTEMADPAVQADTAKFRTHSKSLSEMQPLVDAFREYKSVVEQVAATQELLKDPDIRELAEDELQTLESRRDRLLEDIKLLLIPRDPNDAKNVMLEIRAGTGGDEAALFASDLFRMYSRYAERRGWKLDVLSMSDSGAGGPVDGPGPVLRRVAGGAAAAPGPASGVPGRHRHTRHRAGDARLRVDSPDAVDRGGASAARLGHHPYRRRLAGHRRDRRGSGVRDPLAGPVVHCAAHRTARRNRRRAAAPQSAVVVHHG